MSTPRKAMAALFVDRSCQAWVVRDPNGKFWVVPSGDNPWHRRQPFTPKEETILEPVPAHYKGLLGIPI